jgi:aminopeptidase
MWRGANNLAAGRFLFDEKIGGTVHAALGRSYPETGGKNVSALHWDLICDLRAGGRITADGVTIQEDGRFRL